MSVIRSDDSGGDYWSVSSNLRRYRLCRNHVALQVRLPRKNSVNAAHIVDY